MDDKISIKQWISNYNAGEYDDSDLMTQIRAGWYDWFCRDASLQKKTAKLAPKVKQVSESKKIDVDKMYVFFKNNCPVYGNLYDDFRICDIETGNVIYTITPHSGHKSAAGERAQVWGRENGFNKPLVSGSWNDVKKFFGV